MQAKQRKKIYKGCFFNSMITDVMVGPAQAKKRHIDFQQDSFRSECQPIYLIKQYFKNENVGKTTTKEITITTTTPTIL